MVPVYNVEEYLPACLDSILAQDLADLEVVMVDDGSTDGSAAQAADYAARHSNITLVSSVNRGIGSARNLGVRQSGGEFLAFVDSDDLVLPQAFSVMVSTLEESGSDFAVGSVQRLTGGELVEPPFLRQLHRQRRQRLSIRDQPRMISDSYAWNKVFRRAFWDSAGLKFPEGVRYEDQVTITEAYLRAEAFDVVRRPVYAWRVRPDGTSITQRRYELGDLEERLTTKQMTTDVISRLGPAEVMNFWQSHGLGGDLPLYFRHIPGCSDEYWQRLVSGLQEVYAGHPPLHESRLLRVHQRLVGWLVTHDCRREAETIQRWLAGHPGPLPLRTQGEHVLALLPFHDDPASGIPPELFLLAEHELTFDAQLRTVYNAGRGLEVHGFAVIRGAPTSGTTCTIAACLRSDTGQRLDLEVRPEPSAAVSEWVGRLPQRYDEGGFVTSVDFAQPSVGAEASGGNGRWEMKLSVDVAYISREGQFRSKAPDAGLPLTVSSSPALVASFDRDAGLVITVSSDLP